MIIESGQEPTEREPNTADNLNERKPDQGDECTPDRG